jgi:hypothetical protein
MRYLVTVESAYILLENYLNSIQRRNDLVLPASEGPGDIKNSEFSGRGLCAIMCGVGRTDLTQGESDSSA